MSFPSFSQNASIVTDEAKGRCLVANRGFNVGEIVFVEKSFVYSSANPLPVHECFNYVFKAFKPKELDKIEAMTDFLSNLSRVGSVDTARNLLELVAIYRLNQIGDSDVSSIEMKEKLALFGALTAANLAECVENMKSFRKKFPTVIPAAVTDAAAGGLLGILNTNQVELEGINGSGLFVQMAVAEHNCSPNCSYSTSNDQLYLTAILPISPGDRIAIDYGNYFYDCTAARIQSLFHTYSFLCNCDTCMVRPDTKRGFLCSVCHSRGDAGMTMTIAKGGGRMGGNPTTFGVIYPHGYQHNPVDSPTGGNAAAMASNNTVFASVLVPVATSATPENLVYQHWQCCTCNRRCSEAEIEQFVAYENKIREYLVSGAATGATADTAGDDEDDEDEDEGECIASIEVLNDILKQNIIHCSHYLLFWALEELAMAQVDMINNGYWHGGGGTETENPDDVTKYGLAFQSLEALSQLLILTLPAVHHEKVIHFDKVAQLLVSSCGSIPANAAFAKQQFEKAYQFSILACGKDAPLTQDLLKLATDTPLTVKQLESHYQMRSCTSSEFNSFLGASGPAMGMEFE